MLGSHHAMPSPSVKSKPKPDLINSLSLSLNNANTLINTNVTLCNYYNIIFSSELYLFE